MILDIIALRELMGQCLGSRVIYRDGIQVLLDDTDESWA